MKISLVCAIALTSVLAAAVAETIDFPGIENHLYCPQGASVCKAIKLTVLFAILCLSSGMEYVSNQYSLTFENGKCSFQGLNMPYEGEGFGPGCIYLKCHYVNRSVDIYGCPPPPNVFPLSDYGLADNRIWPNCCPGHEV
uniref:Single domain-containing protein n=1 Tax=Amblyomma triste TaxID=251400 RepID=A0A023G120_AMBTT